MTDAPRKSAAELLGRLGQHPPKPVEVPTFPAGTPFGVRALSDAEIMRCHVKARASVKREFGLTADADLDGTEVVRSEHEVARAAEYLAAAAVNTETGDGFFSDAAEVRRTLTRAELDYVAGQWAEWQQETSPALETLSAAQIKEIVDALGKGLRAAAWPTSWNNYARSTLVRLLRAMDALPPTSTGPTS